MAIVAESAQGGAPDTPIAGVQSVNPAKAGMMVRTAYARRPPAVDPAKAGIP